MYQKHLNITAGENYALKVFAAVFKMKQNHSKVQIVDFSFG